MSVAWRGDNTRMCLKVMGCEGVVWTKLVQYGVKWQVLVNAVNESSSFIKRRNYFPGETISFSKAQIHTVTLDMGLIIIYNISRFLSLLVLYNASIRSKLDYASIVWNNFKVIVANKAENTQRKCASFLLYFLSVIYFM